MAVMPMVMAAAAMMTPMATMFPRLGGGLVLGGLGILGWGLAVLQRWLGAGRDRPGEKQQSDQDPQFASHAGSICVGCDVDPTL
jgi:hypothetical protein